MLKITNVGRLSSRLPQKNHVLGNNFDSTPLRQWAQCMPMRAMGSNNNLQRCQNFRNINHPNWNTMINPQYPDQTFIEISNTLPFLNKAKDCFPKPQAKTGTIDMKQEKYKRVSPEFLKLLDSHKKHETEEPHSSPKVKVKFSVPQNYKEPEKDQGNWKNMRNFLSNFFGKKLTDNNQHSELQKQPNEVGPRIISFNEADPNVIKISSKSSTNSRIKVLETQSYERPSIGSFYSAPFQPRIRARKIEEEKNTRKTINQNTNSNLRIRNFQTKINHFPSNSMPTIFETVERTKIRPKFYVIKNTSFDLPKEKKLGDRKSLKNLKS